MTPTAPRRGLLRTLVAVLSSAALIAGAPTATAATPAAPSAGLPARLIAVQLESLPAVVPHRASLTLRASGALPGLPVQFTRTPVGGSPQPLGSSPAGLDGTAQLVVRALGNASYTASIDLGGGPITSNARSVGVRRVLGPSRSVVDAGRRTVRFTATVSTGSAPGRVVLQRRRGERWVGVASWPARGRSARTVVVPRGRSVHRVVVPATTAYRASASRGVAVRVG